MEDFEQLKSGLYIPNLSPDRGAELREVVESPLMRYLMLNILNGWVFSEGNYNPAWNSPIYDRLLQVQGLTMRGVDLIQKAKDVPQSKGLAVTSMLARGVSLARLSCLSLALGSFSDAFAIYRMLFDRELILRYLEAKNKYEAFAKAFYAEIYQLANKGINDEQLRGASTSSGVEEAKRMMELIRMRYFDNKAPNAPGHYWKRPHTEKLAEEFANGIDSTPDGTTRKQAVRAYDMGNKCVHPRLRDLLQPEDTDISPEELRSLILTTLGGLAMFGLSLFEETSPLIHEIQDIVVQAHREAQSD